MHVNYYCDTCGKAYPNEKEAMECEKKARRGSPRC